MRVLRAAWYILTVLVFTVWHGGVVLVAALFRVRQRPGGIYDRMARQWATHLLEAHRLRVTVDGLEHLVPGQPYVYVSNHVSFVDIWVLLAVLPGTVRFLAKRELLRIPLFGWAMAAAGHIPINRRKLQSAFGSYEAAGRMVRGGTSAIVFGEGTRSRLGRLLPLKKGPFVLAIEAGVPIVPVYVAGTFEVLPKGAVALRRRPITVCLAEPIPTEGCSYDDRDALTARCRAAMEACRAHVDGLPTAD